MIIKLDFQKCIMCTENPPNSKEHIIPESIGGTLEIPALCTDCNSTFGSELVSKVRKDPSIRSAVSNLKREIPDLYETIEKGLPYLAKGNDDTVVKLIRKNGKFIVLSEKKEDGSIIYDSKKAGKNISKMLKKEGLPEHKIVEKIESLKKLKPDEMIQISNNLKAVNRETGPIEQCFVDINKKRVELLDEEVVVLMAYEFLSLLIGNLILDEQFGYVREFIKNRTKSEKLLIEHLTRREYEPYHEIYPELLETEIIINIILFGWMWYKVHFKDFKLSSPDFVYLEDLKNKRSLYAKSVDEAKKGIWYEF